MTFRALDELRAVRDLRDLDVQEKSILFALVLRMNETAECWPSYLTLAEDSGVSVATAKRRVKRLEELGHLTVRRRRIAGSSESETNVYTVKVVSEGHDVVSGRHDLVSEGHDGGGVTETPQVVSGSDRGGVRLTPKLPNELPNELPRFALARSEDVPVKVRKPKKEPKHSRETIEGKQHVVDAFITGVKAAKGTEPKVTHAGDHAAAFALVKTYGAEEACAIVRRALEDDFVVSKNCTLRYVASKPESFRGTATVKSNGRHMVQPAGAEPSWRVGNGQ
jgi:DNA-binding Lrp family transcriptional regulator